MGCNVFASFGTSDESCASTESRSAAVSGRSVDTPARTWRGPTARRVGDALPVRGTVVPGGVTTSGDCGTAGSAGRDNGSAGVTAMGATLAGACRCGVWNARSGVRDGERITGSGCAGTRKAMSTCGLVSTARDVPR